MVVFHIQHIGQTKHNMQITVEVIRKMEPPLATEQILVGTLTLETLRKSQAN